MDKHIELVEKWLANPESVSKEELEENGKAADAYAAAANAAYADADAAAYWVKRYRELTNG